MRVFLAAFACQAHSSLSQPTNPQTNPQRLWSMTQCPQRPPKVPQRP